MSHVFVSHCFLLFDIVNIFDRDLTDQEKDHLRLGDDVEEVNNY